MAKPYKMVGLESVGLQRYHCTVKIPKFDTLWASNYTSDITEVAGLSSVYIY